MSSAGIAELLAHVRECNTSVHGQEVSGSEIVLSCCVGVLPKLAVEWRNISDAIPLSDMVDRSLLPLLKLIRSISNFSSCVDFECAEAVVEIAARLLSIIPTLDLAPSDRDYATRTTLEAMSALLQRDDSASMKVGFHSAACSLCKLLQQPEDSYEMLLHAVKSLHLLLVIPAATIISAAMGTDVIENIATSLLCLLISTSSQRCDIVGEICSVYLLLGDLSGVYQAIWPHELVQALVLQLKKIHQLAVPALPVVRLLLQITKHTHAHGRMVNEGLLPVLFRILAKNRGSSEHVGNVCEILSTLMWFAQECSLDLTPFLKEEICSGRALIDTIEENITNPTVVKDVLLCFVAASKNLHTLSQIVNSESIEEILSLYMLVQTEVTRNIIEEGFVEVISCVGRVGIESINIENSQSTLPALYLCLRGNRDNLQFVSQVYAIVTRHWKANNPDVRAVAGYVEIAVALLQGILSSFSDNWPTEAAELCNFIREILLAPEGNYVVSSCGGSTLLSLFHAKMTGKFSYLAAREDDSAQFTGGFVSALTTESSALRALIFALVQLLETNYVPEFSAVIIDQGKHFPSEDIIRPGDQNYKDYVDAIIKHELASDKTQKLSVKYSCEVSDVHEEHTITQSRQSEFARAEIDPSTLWPHNMDSTSPDDVDGIGSDNSGASDESEVDDDDELPQVELSVDNDVELVNDHAGCGLFEVVNGVENEGKRSALNSVSAKAHEDALSDDESTHWRDSPKHSIPDTLMMGSLSPFGISPDDLQIRDSYYETASGIRFPRHPSRQNSSSHLLGRDLVWAVPDYEEPCFLSNPEEAVAFIANASARRVQYDASSPEECSRVVYQAVSFRELLSQRAQNIVGTIDRMHTSNQQIDGSVNTSISSASNEKPFGGMSCDFECPYPVTSTSSAFSECHHDSLTFDSMFESGNLAMAIRVGESEYDLVLRHDIHTSGHMQWFYFAVSNVQPYLSSCNNRKQYRFNIVNLCKPDSMFNRGLQPLMYSVKEAREKSLGWRRTGQDIYYFANQYPRVRVNSVGNSASRSSSGCYYTLTFTLDFPHADDTYLVAHSYPYTLNTHRLHMNSFRHLETSDMTLTRAERSLGRTIVRRSELCRTVGGTKCDLLTITEFDSSPSNCQELEARRAVFITSRVHPGEPQASWMMRGVIDFLLSDCEVARALRRMFVFYLVPMLNPDGVYFGNNRCNLSACDLNRQWHNPSKELHPTIFHTKELIVREQQTRGVAFYCDLHGHSRKQNVFMYGCDTKKRPSPRARLFPQGLSKVKHSFVSLPDCSFKVSKDKEATARVVLAYELDIPWSFTLEASFCGTNIATRPASDGINGIHFTTHDLCMIGQSLCESLLFNVVTDAVVRERLCASVEDVAIDFPQVVEPFLRETALTGKASAIKAKPFAKSLEESKSLGKSKSKRKVASCLHLSSASSTPPAETPRRSSRTLVNPQAPPKAYPQPPREPILLRKSSSLVVPEQVAPFIGTVVAEVGSSHISIPFDLLASASPRARLGGRKIRMKKSKSSVGRAGAHWHKSLECSPTEADCVLQGPTEKMQPCSGSNKARQSVTRPGPTWPSLSGQEDSSTSTDFFPRAATSAGAVALPDLGYEGVQDLQMGLSFSLTSSSLTSSPSCTSTRSPKPPAPRLRFRGAGKQYSAVSADFPSQQKRSAALELLRAGSSVTYTYDQDLLNTSPISLRQRSVSSVASTPAGTFRGNSTACRLNPLRFERPPTPPRTTTGSTATWSRNA